jgi:hypothetical protein
MSGLSRTPGKRVWVHSPPRVRIPPFPPLVKQIRPFWGVFCFYPPIYPPPFFGMLSQSDGIKPMQLRVRIVGALGTPFKIQLN